MKLAPETHKQLESFFREWTGDERLKLPEIELYVKRGAGFVTKVLKIYGITFGRFVFINPKAVSRDSNGRLGISKELLAHETAHVMQYRKLGWIRFFYSYLHDYWKSLRRRKKWDARSRHEAYLEISHEREAREIAARFVEWSGNGNR